MHVVRNSTRFVPWKQRKALCADLRRVYTSSDEQAALGELEAFEAKWGAQFPMIGEMWRRRWDEISPFLAFPFEIRRAIYTTGCEGVEHQHASTWQEVSFELQLTEARQVAAEWTRRRCAHAPWPWRARPAPRPLKVDIPLCFG